MLEKSDLLAIAQLMVAISPFYSLSYLLINPHYKPFYSISLFIPFHDLTHIFITLCVKCALKINGRQPAQI